MCGHGSDSQRLRMCGNLEFRKVWTLKEHKGHWYIFQNLQFSEVVSIFSLLYILIPCFSSHPIHTNLAEWGPVTILVNAVDRHGQFVRQEAPHSSAPSRVCWTTGTQQQYYSNRDERLFKSNWISNHTSVNRWESNPAIIRNLWLVLT